MSKLPPIQFGTSGWRGLIAKDFTFDRVRLATQGIADFLKAERRKKTSPLAQRKPTLVLGHDARFLGRDFSSPLPRYWRPTASPPYSAIAIRPRR